MKGLIDTTLREGEQGVGVYFSESQRLRIFEGLCRIGIEEVEVGVSAARNKELPAFVTNCRSSLEQMARPPRMALWSRCRRDDIAFAAKLHPDVLSLCVPVSDLHLSARLRMSRAELMDLLRDVLAVARAEFPYVSVGLEDASRANRGFLADLLHLATDYGVDRVRLADTVGILSPVRLQDLIGLVRRLFPGDIGVHCHNDFGMATANAVAALESGADWADTTTLGIGERAGNARLEEVAAYLQMHDSCDFSGQGYDLLAIKKLCWYIATTTGQRIADRKAIVGPGLFKCESGLHTEAIHHAPATYEPFAPETVGAKRLLLYGSKTGRRAIGRKLETLGYHLSGPPLDRLVEAIRSLSAERGRPFEDIELAQLAAALG